MQSRLTPEQTSKLRTVPRRFRATHRQALEGKSRNAAILAQCAECLGWETDPKKGCTSPGCSLYAWRGWASKLTLTAAQRKTLADRARRNFGQGRDATERAAESTIANQDGYGYGSETGRKK